MVFGVVTVAAEAAFCYLGSERLRLHFRLSLCSVALPSLCLEVCLSFVICLKISLPFIQLLLFQQDTFVFYLKLPFKFRNVLQHIEAGVEAPLLVIKILKSWRFF